MDPVVQLLMSRYGFSQASAIAYARHISGTDLNAQFTAESGVDPAFYGMANVQAVAHREKAKAMVNALYPDPEADRTAMRETHEYLMKKRPAKEGPSNFSLSIDGSSRITLPPPVNPLEAIAKKAKK